MQAWLGKVFAPFNRKSHTATAPEVAAANPSTARDDLQVAGNTYLNNGDLAAAEQCYRQALALDPNFAKAYCKLGFVLKEQGRQADAETALRRAAVLEPAIEDVWFMLGDIAQAGAKETDAIMLLQHALSIDPAFEVAYSTLIRVLLRAQQNKQAETLLTQALHHFPQSTEFHFLIGNFQYEAQDFIGSEAHFQTAIIAQPDNGHAHANLALALQKQNKDCDALAVIERALQLQADNLEWRMNRGVILSKLNRLDDAIAVFQQVIAEKHYRFAEQHNPESPECDPVYLKVYVNLSSVYRAQRKLTEAMACLASAMKIDLEHAEAHLNKALLHLTMGEFADGWREYEYRWKNAQFQELKTSRPLWIGEENLSGKTILLHAEQGIGDTIQFVRYVKFVKNLGAKVLLSAPQTLVELLHSVEGVTEVSAIMSDTDFDFHCPLMSLPFAFKTTVDSIPSHTPYLFAQAERANHWATRLSSHNQRRVGLAWAGNPKFRNDHNRSIALRNLLPLRTVTRVSFLSLQKDIPAHDHLAMSEFPELLDLSPEFFDFSETAAVIANLDLVITVDTSVAHLAGAMGKPVWILLPFDSDFRWMLDCQNSPWYPTATLFRQRSIGDWTNVIRDVIKELAHFVQNNGSDDNGLL